MPSWEITTLEYDVPLGRLLERRLREVGVSAAPEPAGDGVRVRLAGKDALQKLSQAVKKVLLRDLQYLVLARMADAMPLSLAEKRTVLTDALYNARMREDGAGLEYALEWFLREERRLCLDGFLHFRMQEVLMLWQLCVEQATGKVYVQKEYGELMQALQLSLHFCARLFDVRELRLAETASFMQLLQAGIIQQTFRQAGMGDFLTA